MSTFNHGNAERLIAELEDIQRNRPQVFNYNFAYPLELHGCGCVATHAVAIGAEAEGFEFCIATSTFGYQTIQRFLACSASEAAVIYGLSGLGFRACCSDYGVSGNGTGIDEAIRRIKFVAARYPKPEIVPVLPAFAPNDAAFLQSVRALIGQPLAEEIA